MTKIPVQLKRAKGVLQNSQGLLLLSDPQLPSLVSLITGESVGGSWWGHPQGNLIYNTMNALAEDPDILMVKFLNKKVTFVARKNWEPLLVIATSEGDWQLKKVSKSTRRLLDTIEKKGHLRVDDPSLKQVPSTEISLGGKILEERLLAFSGSIHTDSGKHIRVFQSWKNWMKERRVKTKITTAEAFEHFKEIQASWMEKYEVPVRLPWPAALEDNAGDGES